MSVKLYFGDLLESDCEYICHQVNCQGAMGSGIAGAIRRKYPKVYDEYLFWNKRFEKMVKPGEYSYEEMLGEVLVVNVNNKKIVNMAAQYGYGVDGLRYTSYDAFWSCLNKIRYYVPKGSKIGFPWQIGCGLGGANWIIINTMIEEALGEDYEVCIYKLESPKKKSVNCINNNMDADWDFAK